MSQEFRDIISKIKCGDLVPPSFTEDDLSKVKSCLPPAQKPISDSGPAEPSFQESCLPDALKQAQQIVEDEQKNFKKSTEVAKVRGRLVEYIDNLQILQAYFAERLNFFLSVSQATNPLNAEKMKVIADLNRLLIFPQANAATINALQDRFTTLSQAATNEVTTRLQNIPEISDSEVGRALFRTNLTDALKKISRKISPTFDENSITFNLSFFELTFGEIQDGQTVYNIPIQASTYLSDKNVLKSIDTTVKLSNLSDRNTNADNESIGLLYDGFGNYGGLYKRLRTPIQSLFTLDERGLTTNPDQVDSKLADSKDAPKTVTEDGLTFYIQNVEKYEGFYESLKDQLPERINTERNTTYPAAINPIIKEIEALARQEAALQIRLYKLEENLSQSTIFNGVNYTTVNSSLSSALLIYKSSVDRVNKKIADAKIEVEKLDELIKEYAVDPDKISAKITAIPCFKTAQVQSGCEEETAKKRGTDPFGIKTLNGTDAGLPDPTTFCYWKYFAEELTMFGLLPVPDIKSPLFRYYPVNGFIPAFPGPIILTLPQRWKTLSVISSPLGTIVVMLSVPITFPSPIPIPIPSVFILYIAPDATKYMILAPNLPFLIQPNQVNIGFEIDSSPASQNPTGLATPYSGLPIKGAFTIPLKLSANAAKAARLAKIAIDVAQGKEIRVQLPNGLPAPGDAGELDLPTLQNSLKSELEFAQDSAETTPLQDFDRLVTNIRTSITTQLDSLGDIATDKIQSVKEKTRNARDKALTSAKLEPGSENRRKLKTASRAIDPAALEDKIDAMIGEVNSIIDSINLGSITYPDDPSKLNPKLPAAVTSIIDLLQLASQGKLKNDQDSNLVKKMKRILKKLDPRQYLTKDSYDLEKDEDIADLKNGLKDMSKACVDYLKGKPTALDQSEARSKKEADEMAEGDREFQDLLVKSLSFTAIALASPPKISVFDPSKPCCEVEAESLFKGVPPEVLAVLSVFSALSAALIDGLDKDSLKNLFGGVRQASADVVKSAFDSLLSMIPAIEIPAGANPVALISSLIVPILSAISLPEAPDPARPILPIQIKIPLDAILKPLLKLALAALIQAIFRLLADLFNKKDGGGVNSEISIDDVVRELDCGAFGIVKLTRIKNNQVEITLPNGKKIKLPLFPDLPLDILKYFALLASTDVISLLKKLILASLDAILGPVEAIVRPILSLIPKGSWESISILDLANPLTALIKLIKKKIKDALGKDLKINLLNLDVYPIILAVALPVLEKLEKFLKEVVYLGTAVLCSTGSAGVQLARLAHPIFNQDDLPPWERLTRKNPLFAIFLDEILYKSTIMSLGTLIFYTKLPGMYGVSTVPSIFAPFPRI